jgi:hypothetical protein
MGLVEILLLVGALFWATAAVELFVAEHRAAKERRRP